MTTLQYESLPQRPPRASRRHKLAPTVIVMEKKEDEKAGGGASDEEVAAATLNVNAAAAGADRPPSSKHEGGTPAAAAVAAPIATVTPRGHLEGARAKRARAEEEGEDKGEDDELEREQANIYSVGVGDVSTNPTPTLSSTSFSRTRAVPGFDFEYLDHTADIQIHSWGPSLEAAFSSAGLGMINYMTPLEGLAAVEERRFSASGHDLDTLLFSFLDELLFAFSTDGFAARELCVLGGIDRDEFSLEAVGRGERFDRERHASGTEVKAITYSAMRIVEEEKEKKRGEADIWVIVDI